MGGVLNLEKLGVKTDLSSTEVDRRIAILKRFRELLSQQRDRFRQYLNVLDKQKEVIEKGSADDLVVHVELEEQIVSDIFVIQKVIDPLEAMYQASFSTNEKTDTSGNPGVLPGEVQEVPSLRAALEELRSEAVIRSERNRNLLTKRMEELRQEMKTLRSNPYAIHRSLYSQESAVMVDIKG
ncbi:MAG: flagellar biosynthesis protein FlgN [Treponema sp.]|nr:flagellar biosynthesis protein FlgN [Treponema sp.]